MTDDRAPWLVVVLTKTALYFLAEVFKAYPELKPWWYKPEGVRRVS